MPPLSGPALHAPPARAAPLLVPLQPTHASATRSDQNVTGPAWFVHNAPKIPGRRRFLAGRPSGSRLGLRLGRRFGLGAGLACRRRLDRGNWLLGRRLGLGAGLACRRRLGLGSRLIGNRSDLGGGLVHSRRSRGRLLGRRGRLGHSNRRLARLGRRLGSPSFGRLDGRFWRRGAVHRQRHLLCRPA